MRVESFQSLTPLHWGERHNLLHDDAILFRGSLCMVCCPEAMKKSKQDTHNHNLALSTKKKEKQSVQSTHRRMMQNLLLEICERVPWILIIPSLSKSFFKRSVHLPRYFYWMSHALRKHKGVLLTSTHMNISKQKEAVHCDQSFICRMLFIFNEQSGHLFGMHPC